MLYGLRAPDFKASGLELMENREYDMESGVTWRLVAGLKFGTYRFSGGFSQVER